MLTEPKVNTKGTPLSPRGFGCIRFNGWDAAGGTMRVVATWPSDGPVLASGQMVGEEEFAGRGAVVEVDYGAGKIVMYGFRVKHRSQTNGTFKLFFNALYKTQ